LIIGASLALMPATRLLHRPDPNPLDSNLRVFAIAHPDTGDACFVATALIGTSVFDF